nr:DNA repair protein RecO [Paraburkholderia rhizosphaerae]
MTQPPEAEPDPAEPAAPRDDARPAARARAKRAAPKKSTTARTPGDDFADAALLEANDPAGSQPGGQAKKPAAKSTSKQADTPDDHEAASGRRATKTPRRTPRAPVSEYRVSEQPAFVLHSYPYRETSLILDVLSRDHGRLALIAKGAKRPHSALRGVLQTFQPLSLAWTGKSEMRTLTGAEWVGGMLPLAGDALLCGFYVNELLVKFCAREDPHPQLFHHYVVTLTRLAHDEPPVQVLRSFERVLLRETGYAMALNRTVAGQPVVPGGRYVFDPERGVRDASDDLPAQWPVVAGQTLLDMEQDDYHRAQTVAQSKTLMRFLLNTYLGGTPLATRQILIDLQNL